MKTSYFSKFNRLSEEEKDKYYPIAISTTVPSWSVYSEHHTFISPKNILPRYKNGEISWEQYTIEYIELLNRLEEIQSVYEFYSKIETEEEKEVVLLCYEKSDAFCHRHILRNFLNNRHHLNIEEL